MKKLIYLLLLHLVYTNVDAQITLPTYPDSIFPTYYHQRVTHFRSLPQTKGDIIFMGNSITDGAEWSELFDDLKVKNRGISGDITAGILHRIDEVANRKPAKVFLLIGTNDLSRNVTPDSVSKNILLAVNYLKQQTPATKVFVQSILPVNNAFGKFGGHTNKGAQIRQLNEQLKQKAASNAYTFVDLYTAFADAKGFLKSSFTNDGLHLTGGGYILWKHLVLPFMYDQQQETSLLPLPQNLQWKAGTFALYNSNSIVISDKVLNNEALWLQTELQKKGLNFSVHTDVKEKANCIVLQLQKVEAPYLTNEAYQLNVNENGVVLTANTPHGIFNGLQTLLQLSADGVMINACTITDYPAFAWRGYMIDVGRNYMSMDLLKQQIDAMARYKLNVFHFHVTEDIAWRLESKLYPQLTAPENMLRNKGQYYSERDIKELIAYCKDRYITFVPEIDMPGHSAAFSRAMKTNMQSDSGMLMVKNILKEFCQTYEVPYLHIGADEVKITNSKFVPEVTAYIESFGKKVIGWQPGGNFTSTTIRQLWMDDNAHHISNNNIQFIDSRHLYLNHMDPLEAVVTIFNRKIGDQDRGDASLLGATLCMWNDRRVENDVDVLRMNPVYPGMLAFAERSWRGGGQKGWVANIGDGNEKGFENFENRLLDQQKLNFKNAAFPYVKQSGTKWQLFGPYQNGGDVFKKFAPETVTSKNLTANKTVTGGTIVLRHWWAPLIKGAIEKAEDSTTWYATTKIWSGVAGEKDFWVGFNNISRSPATDAPPANAWDEKGSTVWVNNNLIAPPVWKRGGQKGSSEVPLVDEGYEYRQPTKIYLRKGWNTVMIKAPISSFKGRDWQNPVKWMFTFLPLNDN